jgi:hypothetical protein
MDVDLFVNISHFIKTGRLLWITGQGIYLKNFERWGWKRMEIRWTDGVRDEVLHIFREGRNILRTLQRRKVNWISYNSRGNCHLKHVIEGKIEVTGIR